MPFLLPLLMQLELGYTPLHSGMMMLPAALAGTVAKRWIAPLVRRYGYDTFLLVNTVIVGSAIVAFALIIARHADFRRNRHPGRVRRGQLHAVRGDEQRHA